MIDLDFFKQINDVYGHPAGDSVLKFVAELLLDNCRASDTVCRYGGEEFCVLMPETDENDAAVWAERITDSLAAPAHPDRTKDICKSPAVSALPSIATTSPDPEELVKLADKALLCAKRSGRDRIVRYTSLVDAT